MRIVVALIAIAIVSAGSGVAANPTQPPSGTNFYLPIIYDSGNQKHGLAWSYRSLDPDAYDDYQITWYYHWASKPTSGVPDHVEFVPMIWCDDSDLWERAIQNIPADHDGYILLANEPEFVEQCNATVERVAKLIHRARQAWPNARLIASQSHVCWWEINPPRPPCGIYNPNRYTVEGMILAYRALYGEDPPLDSYGVHYGNPTFWVDRLSNFLDSQGISAGLWYTEFNYCYQDLAVFGTWLRHLNSHDRVRRYAYWSNLVENDTCALAQMDTGQLTPLGQVYRWVGYR